MRLRAESEFGVSASVIIAVTPPNHRRTNPVLFSIRVNAIGEASADILCVGYVHMSAG